ncbi:MAG: NADH-quinone oxidoreductase subunit J [Campylobacteraceae bacterium]|jgi:NADH-quinone oxidoreductase subunit J|nr:NADH-quinone oxidoreductase subunit J [Campylobacteraceae bacterium]
MYEVIAFYLFAVFTVALFLITVFSKNALHSMSSLAGGMVFVGGLFFLLDAEFIGVVQIIVYTGAVMALYAFGMMFFDTAQEIKENIAAKRAIYTLWIFVAILLVTIVCVPIFANTLQASAPINENVSNAHALGLVMFTKYLAAFELTAIMLLVAMIAGIILVSRKFDTGEVQ